MQGKVWGKTECLIARPGFEMHRIEVKANGYCSKHRHRHKHNMFFVERGALDVVVFRESGLTDTTRCRAGMKTSIEPGLLHLFEAVEPTVAYEIYWPAEIDANDIMRETTGGVRQPILSPSCG
jgi:mannose-6-phosphate isomerase-like protein (cupin superfamily)